MALGIASLTAGRSATDATSYATASISPGSDRWLVIDVYNAKTAPVTTPTVSGLSLTWTEELRQESANENRRLTRFYAWTGTSPGSGAITIDFGANTQLCCSWIVYEITGADSTDPFVQTVGDAPAGSTTSISVTLAAFASTDNRPLITAGHNANEASSEEAGYTEIGDQFGSGENTGHATAWHSTAEDTSPSYSWSTSSAQRVAIASEIKAATGVDATATPATVALSMAAPQASPSAEAVVTPTVAPLSMAVPQASPSAQVVVSPAVVPLTMAVPQALAGVAVVATPAVVGLVMSLPAPALVAQAIVTPSVVPLSVAVPQALTSAGVQVSPATLALVLALSQASPSAEARPSPSTFALVLFAPQVSLLTTVLVSPTTVGLVLSVGVAQALPFADFPGSATNVIVGIGSASSSDSGIGSAASTDVGRGSAGSTDAGVGSAANTDAGRGSATSSLS